MSRRRPRGLGRGRCRAQSHVVGVAILLAITTASLGVLTAGIGVVVESNAAGADVNRVAGDLEDALRPVETTGVRRGTVSFTGGTLSVEQRTIRVLDEDGVVAEREVDVLVFTAGERRVAYAAGAVVRGQGDGARLATDPPLSASEGVLVVGVVDVAADGPDALVATSPTTVHLRSKVSHDRAEPGDGDYRVAIETETPAAWERYFDERGVPTTRQDLDGDGVPSVVADYPGDRTAYVVVHGVDLDLEVTGA